MDARPRAERAPGPRRGDGAGRGRVPPAGSPRPSPPARRWWNSRAGAFGWDGPAAAAGALRALPGRAGAGGRCPAPLRCSCPRRVLTGLVPSRDFQLSLKFKPLIFLAANPVTNRSDFVFPLLPRLDLLCLCYRTIGLRSKCYSGLIPYPGIYFDCPFSLALLIFNRFPFPFKSPLCPPGLASSRSCFHPMWVGPPERCLGSQNPLPPRLRDGASPGGTRSAPGTSASRRCGGGAERKGLLLTGHRPSSQPSD